MTFTNGQENAIKIVGDFIANRYQLDTNDVITLTGPAGSGKSTIVKEIIRRSTIRSVAVSAPTHQAKTVINKMTGYPGETIQSLLGLRPNINMEDFDPTNVMFMPQGQERISEYKLIIIDECSMIGPYIHNLIMKLSKQYKVKILFIGDKYQLPPVEKGNVNAKISKTFTANPQVELTEIMRQDASNPVNELLHIAREDVINGTDLFIPRLTKIVDTFNDKGEGYMLRKGPAFINEIVKLYKSDEAKLDPYNTKLLAFDNATVNSVNSFLRKRINPAEDYIAVGDLIKGYSTVGKETDVPPYFQSHIRNSEDYIITSVEAKTFKICKIPIVLYECKALNCNDTLYMLHPSSKDVFESELVRRHGNGTMFRAWREFYDFKNKILINYEVFNNYDDKVAKKDFDYGYCQTTHKSQGSTYSNVGIYLPSFRACFNNFTRRSLLYVASSRTSKTIYVYDS